MFDFLPGIMQREGIGEEPSFTCKAQCSFFETNIRLSVCYALTG